MIKNQRKEETRMSNGKPTYAGSIKNQGSQVVNAPLAADGKKGNTVVKTGNDLRNGSGK